MTAIPGVRSVCRDELRDDICTYSRPADAQRERAERYDGDLGSKI